jgi:hypothetical protein
LYIAVIECVPAISAAVLRLAEVTAPVVLSVPLPIDVPASRNVTVPVGVPGALLLTVAVKVTLAPWVDGFTEELSEVAELALFTVSATVPAPDP